MSLRLTHAWAAAAVVWLCLWTASTNEAHAECTVAPEPEILATPAVVTGSAITSAAESTRREANGRVIAPVMVNGQGPFRFIVDTGANRSVLSARLVARLGLAPSGSGQVHSIDAVETAPLVEVDSVSYGALTISSGALPVLQGPVLAGEQGLLGVDGMAGRRLHMDFERHCVEISRAAQVRRFRGWGLIQGELRFGHLVVLPGFIGRTRVNVLIDTGSDASLANVALREALGSVRSRVTSHSVHRAFTAGRPIVLDQAVGIPMLKIGNVEISNVPAYVGDYHIFDLWDLHDEPTLLLGMDVISTARAMAIDYQRATVHFRFRTIAPVRSF